MGSDRARLPRTQRPRSFAQERELHKKPHHQRMRPGEGIDGGIPHVIETLAGFKLRFEVYAFPLEVSVIWLTPSRPESGC